MMSLRGREVSWVEQREGRYDKLANGFQKESPLLPFSSSLSNFVGHCTCSIHERSRRCYLLLLYPTCHNFYSTAEINEDFFSA